MDEQVKTHKCVACMVDTIHNQSLQVLTLCGFGALICLGVNIITALMMFALDRNQKSKQ